MNCMNLFITNHKILRQINYCNGLLFSLYIVFSFFFFCYCRFTDYFVFDFKMRKKIVLFLQVILLGDSGVGKTSFIVKYHTNEFRTGSFSATVGIALTVSTHYDSISYFHFIRMLYVSVSIWWNCIVYLGKWYIYIDNVENVLKAFITLILCQYWATSENAKLNFSDWGRDCYMK